MMDPYRCRHPVLEPTKVSKTKTELRCANPFCKELIGWWESSQQDNIYNIAEEERQHLV